MAINIRIKGAKFERDIARKLNDILIVARYRINLPALDEKDLPFQRNQNQSAVGGSDLSNPFGLEIEAKAQESLSINTWWDQTVSSADRTGGIPILVFKQSRKPWRVMMNGYVSIGDSMMQTRVEISFEAFESWFTHYLYQHPNNGL